MTFRSGLHQRGPGQGGVAGSGPGASPHLPSRELNPISPSCEPPLLCKGPRCPAGGEGRSPERFDSAPFPADRAHHQNHEHHYRHLLPKGLQQPFRRSAGATSGSVQHQRGGRAGPPSSLLRRKIPAKCLGPGRTILQGPGSRGGPGATSA